MKRLIIEVEDRLKKAIKRRAITENKSVKDIITPILEDHFGPKPKEVAVDHA